MVVVSHFILMLVCFQEPAITSLVDNINVVYINMGLLNNTGLLWKLQWYLLFL
ncbi:hypothetical protein Fmac_004711 [Flemingia macrophylla]|uniref:Uncharacterized protein n=1 Tax=Flemingia macrophylla TaxID=520843 RepID=A0ABD1N6B3_9FABA